MAVLLITTIIVIMYFVYYFVSTAHSHWARKGVQGPKPHPVFGNIKLKTWIRKDPWITIVLKLYQQYPNEKVVGAYLGLTPVLLIRDPDLMKTVLIKDFASFVNRGLRVGNEPILRNLFAADGDEWKTLRQKLTPIFTTGKLKAIMPLLNTCVEKYTTYLDTLIKTKTARDVKKLNMKYTMKTITSVAFGIDVNSFTEEPTEFEIMANTIFNYTGIRRFVFFLSNIICPEIIEKLNVRTASPDVAKFFLKLVKEIIEERQGNPKFRHDFMDLMIEMKEKRHVTRAKDENFYDLEITHELIAAQAIVFYAAGFETSSGAMSFLMYELALNLGVQARCHEEIDKVMEKYKGQLDYDALKELQYLSMALDEALRKYPVAPVLFRQCVADYKFKDINLSIKNRTKLWMPVMSLHMDAKYFPDPEKFDPERFLPENKEHIQNYYMPFGNGPRNCIGLRLARVQSLLGIAHFLHKFRLSPCEKTPKKIRFDPRRVTLASADGVWLNIERRN